MKIHSHYLNVLDIFSISRQDGLQIFFFLVNKGDENSISYQLHRSITSSLTRSAKKKGFSLCVEL